MEVAIVALSGFGAFVGIAVSCYYDACAARALREDYLRELYRPRNYARSE